MPCSLQQTTQDSQYLLSAQNLSVFEFQAVLSNTVIFAKDLDVE
jgi:hypothetical protein